MCHIQTARFLLQTFVLTDPWSHLAIDFITDVPKSKGNFLGLVRCEKKLQVSVSMPFDYHPQANHQVKRVNQKVGRFLHAYCCNNQNDWAKNIPWAKYIQNLLQLLATNLTPRMLSFLVPMKHCFHGGSG